MSRRRSIQMAILLCAALSALASAAQLPLASAQQPAKEDRAAVSGSWSEKYVAEGSPYRGLVVGVVTVVMLVMVYRFATRRMRSYLEGHAFNPENARRFMRTWKTVWSFFIAVFALISLSGSLKFLGLSAGFLGMMLGWSLQAPVTGLAAWLMIVAKKPFRIGDRVIIAGTIGDVTDITLTHVVLNQVGGTVGGEEQSGRGILIPNAILFSHVITNYTLEQKFMLDEVPVRVSFESDMDQAKKILLDAANSVTREIIADTGSEPFLRLEFYDAGVLMRLRYLTVPAERQRISSEIVDWVLSEFKNNYPRVRFGYPHSVVRYRSEGETDKPPALRDS